MTDNIYKNYEISISTNINNVTYLARNKAGNIIFRAASQKLLKKAIDEALELKSQQIVQLAKDKKKQEIASKRKKNIEARLKKENEILSKLQEEKQKINRDSSGKFVSRTQAVDSTYKPAKPEKQSFWEKLKG